MKSCRPRTLRYTILAAIVLPVGFLIGGLSAIAFLDADDTADVTITDRATEPPSQAKQLLDAHRDDCWTGTEPALVKVPGHVIVAYPDDRAVYSARLVAPALESIFDNRDVAFTVVAFCK